MGILKESFYLVIGISSFFRKEELCNMKTKQLIYMKRKIVLGTIPVVAILLIWLVWIRFIAPTKTMESSLNESIPLERISSFDLTMDIRDIFYSLFYTETNKKEKIRQVLTHKNKEEKIRKKPTYSLFFI